MISHNVSKIYETLTDVEREELRKLLEQRANSATSADEQRKQHRRRDFQPIELPGGPLSDDIIRDRR